MVKLWVKHVWCGRSENSLLVYDAFQAHLVSDIKELIKEHNTDICVIPGGLTSY